MSSQTCQNHLGKEKSPYLLQHKDNPVCWYAWGPEAFKAAKDQNKPIFLSIGYSTCHWCHVMEKQCFEVQEVADALNKDYISIKVDREERPDVDSIYMDAVVSMRGSGGWPMSVILTPDLKPFFGGTYFPKQSFLQVLDGIQRLWKTDPSRAIKTSQEIVRHIEQNNQVHSSDMTLSNKIFQTTFEYLQKTFDTVHGGFGKAPKFPPSARLKVLLRIHNRTKDPRPLKIVEKTLDAMAKGGMYDHLGGGFHRYSTDTKWLVPHFEKMLYDNAALSQVYLEAYQVTGNPMYAQVAKETLDYILRDMTSSEGGFYSAEDADSEGEEGTFYVWKQSELKKLLNAEEFKKVSEVYQVTSAGNFEHHTNILNLNSKFDWTIKADPILKSAHKILFEARKKRIPPYKDDKIVSSWNGLMMASMAKGYQVLQDKRYLEAAQKSALFLKNKAYDGKQLFRRYRDGERKFAGTLDDYSYVIQGLLEVYQSDFNSQWLDWAIKLQSIQDNDFWDVKDSGYFYANSSQKELIVKTKDFSDNARPNSNGMAALNLMQLYGLTLDSKYKEKALKIFNAIGPRLEKFPPAFSQSLLAMDLILDKGKEVAIVGASGDSGLERMVHFIHKTFLPNQVTAVSKSNAPSSIPVLKGKTAKNNKTTIYVCEQFICKAPTTSVDQAEKTMLEVSEYKL